MHWLSLAMGSMKRALSAIGLMIFFFSSGAAAEKKVESVVILTPIYKIDRVYKSMLGPSAEQVAEVSNGGPPELLWMRGFKVEVVGPDAKTSMPKELMCHVTVDVDMKKHRTIFNQSRVTPLNRLFILSQGQFSVEFPRGFGIPVMSNEPLQIATQVLNHNFEHANFQVRYKLTLEFIRDRNLKTPLKPLLSKC